MKELNKEKRKGLTLRKFKIAEIKNQKIIIGGGAHKTVATTQPDDDQNI